MQKKANIYVFGIGAGWFSIRLDGAGITSFIRAITLESTLHRGFLHFFNYSGGVRFEWLTRLWIGLAYRLFPVLRVEGYVVYAADGLKVAKEGKRMPGVKKLHQNSEDTKKAPYIMGHSFQVIALLLCIAGGNVAAIPLVTRLHEGVIWFPGDRRSLLDKFVSLFRWLVSPMSEKALLVADALHSSLLEFLVNSPDDHKLKKILSENIAIQKLEEYQLAA